MEILNKMYWRDLVFMLLQNEIPQNIEVDFNDEKIGFSQAALLNQHNFRVPEKLIEYADDDIDFSDDPDITDEDFRSGKLSWSVRANFNLEPEIALWIKKEKIELNTLIPQLMKNFYETLKQLKKNAAL